MSTSFLDLFKQKGIKKTPQRIAIYNAILQLNNHPTADKIITKIQKQYPTISVGTVYKTLDFFVNNNLLRKVKTEKDIMRYDPILDNHHHLYCTKTDRIEDYQNEQLNQIIQNYFNEHQIKNFKIQKINLQITGSFSK